MRADLLEACVKTAVLAPLLVVGWTCASITQAGDRAGTELGSVEGRVVLLGPVPELQSWPMTDEMLPFHSSPEFVDESWLVSPSGGVENCVVMAEPLNPDSPTATPLEGALYEKVGPRFEPRVLVVTPGTVVTLRNRNSPCKGFACRGLRNQFNFMLTAGNERAEILQGSGPNPIGCDIRPYMSGVVFVSESPYYALSGPDGCFSIEDLPPGRYRVRLWHEHLRSLGDVEPREITVEAGQTQDLSYELRVAGS